MPLLLLFLVVCPSRDLCLLQVLGAVVAIVIFWIWPVCWHSSDVAIGFFSLGTCWSVAMSCLMCSMGFLTNPLYSPDRSELPVLGVLVFAVACAHRWDRCTLSTFPSIHRRCRLSDSPSSCRICNAMGRRRMPWLLWSCWETGDLCCDGLEVSKKGIRVAFCPMELCQCDADTSGVEQLPFGAEHSSFA